MNVTNEIFKKRVKARFGTKHDRTRKKWFRM